MGLTFDDTAELPEGKLAGNEFARLLREHTNDNADIIPSESFKADSFFFAQQISNPKSPFFMQGSIPTLEDLVKAAEAAGGEVHIATPHYYDGSIHTQAEMDAFILERVGRGAHGLEINNAYNQSNNPDIKLAQQLALNSAVKYPLHLSGGTAMHAPGDVGYTLGRPEISPRYADVGKLLTPEGKIVTIPDTASGIWAPVWCFEQQRTLTDTELTNTGHPTTGEEEK